jgi:hypothetical protein
MQDYTQSLSLNRSKISSLVSALSLAAMLCPTMLQPAQAQTLTAEVSESLVTRQAGHEAREHLLESSRRIAELVKQRPVFNLSREAPTPDEVEKQQRIDAAINAIRKERTAALIEVVLADNPAVEIIDSDWGIYAVPLGDPSGKHQWMSGSILPIWHLNNLDLSVIALAPAVRARPHAASLPDGTTAVGHLMLGGTSGQSGVHPYPGDIDFAEELIIAAPTEAAAEQAMAALVIEFVSRSRSEPSVEFDSLAIMPPADRRIPDSSYRWSLERVLDPSQRGELIRQLASTRGNGRLNTDWRALTVDGRYIVIGKIFRFIVYNSATGEAIFSTYPMSTEFQETYLGGEIPKRPEIVSLGHYAAVMRGLAKKEVKREHYLKAAKRAFNYARAIGDLDTMAALVPIFASPEARVNENVKALEAIAMALDPAVGSEILTTEGARRLLTEVAMDMESDLAVAPGTIPERPALVARELRTIAAELRVRKTAPVWILEPDARLAERLDNLIEVEILPMIRLALKARVSAIVDSI